MQTRQKQQMSSTHINIMTFFIAKKKKKRKKEYQKEEVLSGETEINLCLSHSCPCQIEIVGFWLMVGRTKVSDFWLVLGGSEPHESLH